MNEHDERTRESLWPAAHARGTEAARSLPAVDAIMSTDVLTVNEDMPRDMALRLLVERCVSGVPVVRGLVPVGVVSVRDLVEPEGARDQDNEYPLYYRLDGIVAPACPADGVAVEGRVGDVMHPFVLSIEASANLVQAANRMLSEGVNRLLVRDGTDLVGVVTSTDLLGGFALWCAAEMGLGGDARPAATIDATADATVDTTAKTRVEASAAGPGPAGTEAGAASHA